MATGSSHTERNCTLPIDMSPAMSFHSKTIWISLTWLKSRVLPSMSLTSRQRHEDVLRAVAQPEAAQLDGHALAAVLHEVEVGAQVAVDVGAQAQHLVAAERGRVVPAHGPARPGGRVVVDADHGRVRFVLARQGRFRRVIAGGGHVGCAQQLAVHQGQRRDGRRRDGGDERGRGQGRGRRGRLEHAAAGEDEHAERKHGGTPRTSRRWARALRGLLRNAGSRQ